MKLRIILLLLVLLGYSFALFAENESQDNSQPKEASTNTKSTPKKSKRRQVKTLEEFIPSEEVSADKPVAFPSDI